MTEWIQRATENLNRAHRFVTYDVWRIGRPGEPVPSGFIAKQVRVAILLLRNLGEDALLVRAAALAFTTALALVPLLAFTFLTIQSFNLGNSLYAGLQHQLEAGIDRAVDTVFGDSPEAPPPVDSSADQPRPAVESEDGAAEDAGSVPLTQPDGASPQDANAALKSKIIESLFRGVTSTSADGNGAVSEYLAQWGDQAVSRLTEDGVLSTVGVIFVIFTVFGLMQNVERSFNHIWGVTRSRRWIRMISDYLFVTLLLPFFIAVVLGITAALESQAVVERLGVFAFSVRSVQFLMIWLFMAALYAYVPNARVEKTYALLGGFTSAALWTLMSWGYVRFLVSITNYNIIYSSFAQVPLLLMWIYFSWLILLFGAEVAFAYQHEKTFALERLADNASHAYKEAVGLRAMVEMAGRFDEGKPGLSPVEAAEEWNVPVRLVNQMLDALQKAGLVTQCSGEAVRYQPARSIDRITIGETVTALREAGEDPSAFREDDAYRALFDQASGAGQSVMQLTVGEIVRKLRVPESNVERFPKEIEK